jgi:CheY-like chemotaxis protein
MLSRLIGENVAIRLDLDPHPWRVRADRGHIEQIIMNLAINARDAMPGGGTLRIGTSRVSVEGREPARGHVLPAPGPYLCLTLADTGVGMQAAVQSRIFEPFFTTKDAHGTGLGLATVSGIVEQCQGRIFVESRPERGTVFTIYFPAIAAEERSAPLAPASPESVSGCETVLVVEDDETVRDLTVRALCRHGYRVLSARRAEEAMTVAARFQDRIHVLVTDVMLPGASGASLAESLSRSREGLCVLYSSGYAQSGSEPLVAGSEFVQKPYSARELLQAVRELLDRRAVI